MTNQDMFIETFGREIYDKIIEDCNDITILKFFLKEYMGISSIKPDDEFVDISEAVIEEPVKKKRGHKKGVRHYNTKWYEMIVEDFYLGTERTRDVKLTDDETAIPAKSLDALCSRLKSAIKTLAIDDCVSAHKYYRGTVNECVVLENLRNPKTFVGSYKLS